MTERERYIATLTFQEPDRIPFQPGKGRQSTLKAWHSQGLPEEITDYTAYVREVIGIEPGVGKSGPDPNINFKMIPEFEEKVLERRDGTLIVQDWKGNVCQISDQFDTTYLRSAIDFVTRKWIRCPVGTRRDWPDMERRYEADDFRRLPEDFVARGAQLRNRDYPIGITFSGPFWQLREWLGFEGLCMLFLDDPDFVREMISFWEGFVRRLLERTFEHFVPDWITVSEDMAYKQKPMIGPEMAREFLLPCWRTWFGVMRSAGVPILEIDSDGSIGDLIPVWIDAGANANRPIEVAAGNDLPAMRKRFGTKMAYRGGVDKRAMAKGGQAIIDEMAQLSPAIRSGGVLPGCDHGIPSDVSWPNFVEYCRLLARETGWLN